MALVLVLIAERGKLFTAPSAHQTVSAEAAH